MGKVYHDWEDKHYLQHYRMTKESFWYLCQRYGFLFQETRDDYETNTESWEKISNSVALACTGEQLF